MKLLKKRPVAILIMIAAILLSVFIGGRRSLLAERDRVEELFFTAEGDGYSIQSDLEYIGTTANNLKNVALRYLDAADPYIVQLNDARAALDGAQTVEEKHDAAGALFGVVDALYSHLDPTAFKMNSTDRSFRASLYEDIAAAMKRIEENVYNVSAREFNDMLDSPLTGAIAALTGVEPVPIYG